jgi:hypothetical protein
VALLLGGLLALEHGLAATTALGGGALVGLSLLVKPTAVLLAPTLLFGQRFARRWFLAGVAAAFILWIPYLDAGPKLATAFLRYAEHWRFNDALYTLLVAAGAAPRHARALLAGVLVACAFAIARRLREPAAAAGPAFFALLVCSPTVHPWYALWLAPFLPLLPRALRTAGAALCALLPLSYVSAWMRGRTGVWQEPEWPRLVLWGVVFALIAAGLVRARSRVTATRDHPGG